MSAASSRYSRQIRFQPIGEEGQKRIGESRVLLCGCGALGSVIAERLARAGVGQIRIVDRDWVEKSNLQRQALFTEADAREARPKAVAAAEALSRINSDINIESRVEDIHFDNLSKLAADCDLIIDGTDNFETRFLINDFAIKNQVPWIHGGCLGAGGQGMVILPGESACFRCLVPELPSREHMETCDSAGVLGSAIGLVASWQAGEALKILSGNQAAVTQGLWVMDSWNNDYRVLQLKPNANCPCCAGGEYPFLSGKIRSQTTVLCGKNAVQIDVPTKPNATLEDIAERVAELGDVRKNAYFVRVATNEHTITIFRDGRTVIEGTTDESEAKSIATRVLGG